MDYRRLDTMALMSMGILDTPPPKTDIPEDKEVWSARDGGWDYPGDKAVTEALLAGMVVDAPNYYGIPHIWKVDGEDKYRGQLLQYRQITEDKTFDSPEEAVEWFHDMYFDTEG